MRFFFLAAMLSTISAAGFAAEAGGNKSAPPPEQNRCFCIQETEDPTEPYRIVRFTPPEPGCNKVKYDPGPKGTTPEMNGLLNCNALKECFKEEQVLKAKAKVLHKRGNEADAIAKKCCYNGSCDESCLSKWHKAGSMVAKDSKDLAVSESKKQPCIPVRKEKTLAESLNMNIDGLMPH